MHKLSLFGHIRVIILYSLHSNFLFKLLTSQPVKTKRLFRVMELVTKTSLLFYRITSHYEEKFISLTLHLRRQQSILDVYSTIQKLQDMSMLQIIGKIKTLILTFSHSQHTRRLVSSTINKEWVAGWRSG